MKKKHKLKKGRPKGHIGNRFHVEEEVSRTAQLLYRQRIDVLSFCNALKLRYIDCALVDDGLRVFHAAKRLGMNHALVYHYKKKGRERVKRISTEDKSSSNARIRAYPDPKRRY